MGDWRWRGQGGGYKNDPHTTQSIGPPPQVGNLPWDMTPESLREVFDKFRPYDAHIKTNMSGRSRGALYRGVR